MTDQQQPADGKAVPANTPIPIDAIAGLFERREARERDEALRLAAQVRALTEIVQAQAVEIERLRKPPEAEQDTQQPAPKRNAGSAAAEKSAVNAH